MELPHLFLYINIITVTIKTVDFSFFLPPPSFISDVSHGEHGRKAGELWRLEARRAAQFTATLGPSTVQLPLASAFPLRGHPPQRKGALRLQVKTLGSLRDPRASPTFHAELPAPLSVHSLPPGTAGKSSLDRQTSPDTCGRTQGSSPTGTGFTASFLAALARTLQPD